MKKIAFLIVLLMLTSSMSMVWANDGEGSSDWLGDTDETEELEEEVIDTTKENETSSDEDLIMNDSTGEQEHISDFFDEEDSFFSNTNEDNSFSSLSNMFPRIKVSDGNTFLRFIMRKLNHVIFSIQMIAQPLVVMIFMISVLILILGALYSPFIAKGMQGMILSSIGFTLITYSVEIIGAIAGYFSY